MVRPLFPETSNNLLSHISDEELVEVIISLELRKEQTRPINKRKSKNNLSFNQSFMKKKMETEASFQKEMYQVKEKETKLVAPLLLYHQIQKLFAAVGVSGVLFHRERSTYPEYCQTILTDFEKKLESENNIKVAFFKDGKDPSKIGNCSHYAACQLLNQLVSKGILNESFSEPNNQPKLAFKYNKTVLANLAWELSSILDIQKLEKQTGVWEMICPTPMDKKVLRQFRPKGQCMATLFSNKGKLKVLAQGKDNHFFSGSDQGELRIFDFEKFSSEKESLLRGTIDMNHLINKTHNKKRGSFSTCQER